MDATVVVVAALGAVLAIIIIGYLSELGARRRREQERMAAAHRAAVARVPREPFVPVYQPPEPEVEAFTGTAYCIRCKAKREFTGTVSLSVKGDRVTRMARGHCPVCGAGVSRILPKSG